MQSILPTYTRCCTIFVPHRPPYDIHHPPPVVQYLSYTGRHTIFVLHWLPYDIHHTPVAVRYSSSYVGRRQYSLYTGRHTIFIIHPYGRLCFLVCQSDSSQQQCFLPFQEKSFPEDQGHHPAAGLYRVQGHFPSSLQFPTPFGSPVALSVPREPICLYRRP